MSESKGEAIKAKGDELIEKFIPFSDKGKSMYNLPQAKEKLKNARQCAIIAVEEIINELPDTICGYMPEGGTAMEIDNYRKYFYKDVLNYLKSKQ